MILNTFLSIYNWLYHKFPLNSISRKKPNKYPTFSPTLYLPYYTFPDAPQLTQQFPTTGKNLPDDSLAGKSLRLRTGFTGVLRFQSPPLCGPDQQTGGISSTGQIEVHKRVFMCTAIQDFDLRQSEHLWEFYR